MSGGRGDGGVDLLRVEDLHVNAHEAGGSSGRRRDFPILAGVDIAIGPAEFVGVIGETGSGKTTLARTIVGLLPAAGGSVSLAGRDISSLSRRDRREQRRRGDVQLVFQDPLKSVDPDLMVGAVVAEGLELSGRGDRGERQARVERALALVGLDPVLTTRRPDQISGGQRQRLAIARAIVMEPKLLICDEPVSALDASNRNHILRLLLRLRDELGVAIAVIAHDLASIAAVIDRVVVLYHGSIVEDGPTASVFRSPAHPYTALLIASAPAVSRAAWGFDLGPEDLRVPVERQAAEGGCPFIAQCRFATEICSSDRPPARPTGADHAVACHHATSWRDQVGGAAGAAAHRSPLPTPETTARS